MTAMSSRYRPAPSPPAKPKISFGSYLDQMNALQERLAQQPEDVDMEAEAYVAAHPEYEQADIPALQPGGVQRYLTLDTNVLINHLELVQRVFERFSSETQDPISLLVPTVVINELDKLASSQHADSLASTSDTLPRARAATSWLLSINRHRRETGFGAIRCQRWSERGDRATNLRKADDRVLDCALYFRKIGGGSVMLWTEDRNLSLLAEAEDISTIPSPTPSLGVIMQQCGIPDWINTLQVDAMPDNASDGGMQIDTDLYPVEPVRSPSPPRRPQSSPKAPNGPRGTSSSTSNARNGLFKSIPPPPSRTALPTELLVRLTLFANRVLNAIPSTPSFLPPPAVPPHPTTATTHAALTRLTDAIGRFEPPHGDPDSFRQHYRLQSCLMTLSDWVRPAEGKNQRQVVQVLSRDASEALAGVLQVLPDVGMALDVEEWRDLVDTIKRS